MEEQREDEAQDDEMIVNHLRRGCSRLNLPARERPIILYDRRVSLLRLSTNDADCAVRRYRSPRPSVIRLADNVGSAPPQRLRQFRQLRGYVSRTRVDVLDKGVEPERVQPYMRSCVAAESADEQIKSRGGRSQSMDMEFVISFLGTGGGAPSQHRNGSCTALRLGGQTFLFDTCEGTLRQLEHTTIKPISITKIFISHLHGDHVYGLVPVILSILVAHKAALHNPSSQYQKRRAHRGGGGNPRIQIYGPPGLYNYLCMVLTLSCAKVNYVQVDVIELVGGRNERGPTHKKGQRNPFLSHYPEFAMPNVSRKYLEKSKDLGIWVIDAPETVDKAIANKGVVADKLDGFHRLPNDINLGIDRRLHIKAAEIDHITGVQTFGFSVEEQQPPGNIDVEKAKSLGVMPSKKYSLLKCGIAVPTDDDTGMVQPGEVLTQIFRPRKFALIADHRLVFKEMEGLAEDADMVVHEATLSKTDGVEVRILEAHVCCKSKVSHCPSNTRFLFRKSK